MSNRLFFTVPLVLMGVLSGCNSIPVQNLFGNSNGSNLQSEAPTYAREVLQCKSNEYMPTTQAVNFANQSSRTGLVTSGKDVGKLYSEFAYNQNCDLVSRAYITCGDGFDRYDCIQGYVYKAISFDKKDISRLVEEKAKAESQRQAEIGKKLEEGRLEKQRAAHKKIEDQRLAAEKEETERKKQQELNFQSALNELKNDPAFSKTYDILMNKWDDQSRDEFRKNPSFVAMLHRDVKAGFYDKVKPYAEKKKAEDNSRNSDFEYFKRGAKVYIEHLSSNETLLDTNITWYVNQINERKLKLTKLKKGSKEYAELDSELEHLNHELRPLNAAKKMIADRNQAMSDRQQAQEREYQQRQLDQQRQAQQAQLEYQRKQLELQRQQAEALEETNNPFSLQNRVKSLEDMNRRNKPVNCSTVGGVTTCF